MLKQISLQDFLAIYLHDINEHPDSHIEFISIDQQRLFYVLLNDETFRLHALLIHLYTDLER